jgi:hypothetical protein
VTSVTAARLRPVPIALARAVPTWAWLAGILVVSVVVRYAFARRMPAPWIMVDELIYSELAKSFASSGAFLLREAGAGGAYGVVYPILISPAYLLFESVPEAYAAAKAINAVLMSLAALPAYALARRVLRPPLALVAAGLTVAVPSTLYAGTMMTENAFYPLFLLAALGLYAVLERPTWGRSAVFLAALALVFLTRAQAVVLVPAALTAPLLLVLLRRSGRAGLWEFRRLYAAVGAATLAVIAAAALRGRSPDALLGAYSDATGSGYDFVEVARWFAYHAAELDLYLGILPFAALLLLVVRARSLTFAEQVFVSTATCVAFWTLVVVAAFASRHTFPPRVEERNMFVVAPLFLIALLVLVERGLPRPRIAAAAAALVAGLLPAVLPFRELIGVQAQSDTLAMLMLWHVHTNWVALDSMWLAVAAAGLGAAALFLFLPARYALVLPAAVLAYFLVSLKPIEAGPQGIRQASAGALFQGIGADRRDWIDAAVGPEQDVAVVWSGLTDAFTVWENEFFNRSVGRVFHLRGPVPSGLAQTPLAIDPADGMFRNDEARLVRAAYALTDDSVPLVGDEIVRDDAKGLAVLRVDGYLRSREFVRGRYDDGWSGPALVYTRFRCPGGRLAVTVASDPKLFRRPQTVTALAAGQTIGRAAVRPDGRATMSLPLIRRRDGRCRVLFRIAPTAVPAAVQQGSDDTRRLGLRFLALEYQA